VSNCILNWKIRKGERLVIPGLMCWEIWKHRNLAIFEDRLVNRDRVCSSIIQVLGGIKIGQNRKERRMDEASQEICGAGAVLKCPVLGTYRIKMNCGSGSNTKAELLALWYILYFAHFKLVGDSKVIIDLQVVYLQPWMKKIRDLSRKFT